MNRRTGNKECRIPNDGAGEAPAILMISNEQRRKSFGYCKAAWEAVGAPGGFEDWRHEQQQLCGVSSLKFAPREAFFKLVQHYTEILRKHEGRKRIGRASGQAGKPAPHGPDRPRRVLVECCTNPAQMGKIEALLTDMSLPWEYADSMAKHMYKVRRVEWCNSREKRGIITALVKRQQKHGGRRIEPKSVEHGKPNVEGRPGVTL